MFGLGFLFYVIVLLLNAVAILNEERFLARLIGDEGPTFGGMPDDSFKGRLLSLVRAIRTVMRPVLVTSNVLIIVYEIAFG